MDVEPSPSKVPFLWLPHHDELKSEPVSQNKPCLLSEYFITEPRGDIKRIKILIQDFKLFRSNYQHYVPDLVHRLGGHFFWWLWANTRHSKLTKQKTCFGYEVFCPWFLLCWLWALERQNMTKAETGWGGNYFTHGGRKRRDRRNKDKRRHAFQGMSQVPTSSR